MKKILALVFTSALLFSAACDDSSTDSSAANKSDTQKVHKTDDSRHEKQTKEKPKKEKASNTDKKKAKKTDEKSHHKKVNKSDKEKEHKAAMSTKKTSKSDSGKKHNKKKTNKVSVPSDLKRATVTKNVDGDTIHINLKGKDENVRMLLIDTPEDVHPSKPVEPYGRKAAAYAEKKLPVGKKIYIKEGVEKRDKYDRLLAYVYITPQDMYNEDVVKKGYARVGYVYNDTTYLSKLKSAQQDAKEHNRRIWSIPGYVDNENDTFDLKVSCKWAKKHNESTRGCSDQKSSTSSNSNSSSGLCSSSSSNSSNSSSSSSSHHKSNHRSLHSSSSNNSSSHSSNSNNSADSKSSKPHGKCKIKGTKSKIYHLPGDAYYDRTKNVEEWFCSEAEAKKAGYRPSKR